MWLYHSWLALARAYVYAHAPTQRNTYFCFQYHTAEREVRVRKKGTEEVAAHWR